VNKVEKQILVMGQIVNDELLNKKTIPTPSVWCLCRATLIAQFQ
jgi:hypothetical protein